MKCIVILTPQVLLITEHFDHFGQRKKTLCRYLISKLPLRMKIVHSTYLLGIRIDEMHLCRDDLTFSSLGVRIHHFSNLLSNPVDEEPVTVPVKKIGFAYRVLVHYL